MNTAQMMIKLRTKLFILTPETVDIREIGEFNLTMMTCMGWRDVTKKTCILALKRAGNLFLVRTQSKKKYLYII